MSRIKIFLSALIFLSTLLHFRDSFKTRYEHGRIQSLKFRLPDDSSISGWGAIWEYYHFVHDFAPQILEAFDSNPLMQNLTLYVRADLRPYHRVNEYILHQTNQFSCENRFYPSLWGNENRSIQPHLDFFFGKEMVNIVPIATHLLNNHSVVSAPVLKTWKNVQFEGWENAASLPASLYLRFREFAYQKAGISNSHIKKLDVILVKRIHLDYDTGLETGAARRHMDDSFFREAELYFTQQNLRYQILSFEVMPLIDQIKLSASTKILIGAHGAGLANMIFTKPDTMILELGIKMGRNQKQQNCFKHFANQLGLAYHNVARKEVNDINGSDFNDEIKSTILKFL